MNETDRRLRDSGWRLASLLDLGAPAAVVVQECGLLLRAMASRVGPGTVRTWVDEWVTAVAADVTASFTTAAPTECPHCRGLGRTHTADGRNPQCPHCCGLGVG